MTAFIITILVVIPFVAIVADRLRWLPANRKHFADWKAAKEERDRNWGRG